MALPLKKKIKRISEVSIELTPDQVRAALMAYVTSNVSVITNESCEGAALVLTVTGSGKPKSCHMTFTIVEKEAQPAGAAAS